VFCYKPIANIVGVTMMHCSGTLSPGLRSRCRSSNQSEFFWWSRIPKNTRSRSRTFLSDWRSPIE